MTYKAPELHKIWQSPDHEASKIVGNGRMEELELAASLFLCRWEVYVRGFNFCRMFFLFVANWISWSCKENFFSFFKVPTRKKPFSNLPVLCYVWLIKVLIYKNNLRRALALSCIFFLSPWFCFFFKPVLSIQSNLIREYRKKTSF